MKPGDTQDSGGTRKETLATPPEMSVEPAHLWFALSTAFHSIRAHIEACIQRLGLSESDFAVLEALFHNGPMRVNNLGRKVNLASSSITASVDRLEGRKLVRRQDDGHDRRSRLVTLTGEGAGIIARALADQQNAAEESAAALSIEERDQLLRLLRKWGHSAESRCGQKDEASLDAEPPL